MAVSKIYTMTLAEAKAHGEELRAKAVRAREDSETTWSIWEIAQGVGSGEEERERMKAAAHAAELESQADQWDQEFSEILVIANASLEDFQPGDTFAADLADAWDEYVADQLETEKALAAAEAATMAQQEKEWEKARDLLLAETGTTKEDYARQYQVRVNELLATNPTISVVANGQTLVGVNAANYIVKQELIVEQSDFGQPRPEYKEQCFLLANLFDLVAYKKDQPAQVPYTIPNASSTYASIVMEGDPYKFMNLLTQYPSHKDLYNLKTEEISQLQPMIRLFKITDIPRAPYEILQEIRFESHLSSNDITEVLTKSTVRGVGVGISDFTFSYEADNPFAIKKSIKAKLTLFANSFDELLRDRSKSEEEEWTYADLALKTGSPLTKTYLSPQNMGGDVVYDIDKLNFRLKAVVGWAVPKGNTTFMDTTIQNAIYNSFVSLNLTPTVHEFDIDDLGRVTFTINYLAYIEDFFDQSGFNIFADPVTSGRFLKRKLIYQDMITNCNNATALSNQKKKWQDEIDTDKKLGLRALMKKMQGEPSTDEDPERHERTSKIYVIELDYDEIETFMKEGAHYVAENLSISKDISDDLTGAIMSSADGLFTDADAHRENLRAAGGGPAAAARIAELRAIDAAAGRESVTDMAGTAAHDPSTGTLVFGAGGGGTVVPAGATISSNHPDGPIVIPERVDLPPDVVSKFLAGFDPQAPDD